MCEMIKLGLQLNSLGVQLKFHINIQYSRKEFQNYFSFETHILPLLLLFIIISRIAFNQNVDKIIRTLWKLQND